MSGAKENIAGTDDRATAKKDSGRKYTLATKRPLEHIEELSEYEKQVQQNIADKKAVLEALNINDMRNSLQVLKPKIFKPKINKPKPILPCRPKSLRLQSCRPDGEPIEKKSAGTSASIHVKNDPDQMLPPILKASNGILKMRKVCLRIFTEDNPEACAKLLKNLSKSVSSYFISKHDPLSIQKSMESFVSWISSSKLSSSGVRRIMQYKCTSLAVHPSEDKLIICCGSQNGELGITDMSSDDVGQELALMPHCSKISQMAFCHQNPSLLFTGSHDGTVLCADFHEQKFKQVFATFEKGYLPIQFDFVGPKVLCISHGNGFASITDTRTAGMGRPSTYQLEEKAIRSISVHPTSNYCFMTAGHGPKIVPLFDKAHEKGPIVIINFTTDFLKRIEMNVSSSGVQVRYVKMWDTRYLKKRSPEPYQTIDCPGFVYSASFSPITGNYIAITTIEHIRILEKMNAELKQVSQFENPSTCIPCWHPQRDDVLAIGNPSPSAMPLAPRKIVLQSSQGALLHEFMDSLLSSTCHIFAFHPNLPVFIGGSRQGKIFVFQ